MYTNLLRGGVQQITRWVHVSCARVYAEDSMRPSVGSRLMYVRYIRMFLTNTNNALAVTHNIRFHIAHYLHCLFLQHTTQHTAAVQWITVNNNNKLFSKISQSIQSIFVLYFMCEYGERGVADWLVVVRHAAMPYRIGDSRHRQQQEKQLMAT